jgi:hypothetical protein
VAEYGFDNQDNSASGGMVRNTPGKQLVGKMEPTKEIVQINL